MSQFLTQQREADERAELLDLLKVIRPSYGAVGSRDVDVSAQQQRIDRAIELLGRAALAQSEAPAPISEDDALLMEAFDFGQFAADTLGIGGSNRGLAEPVRAALVHMLEKRYAELYSAQQAPARTPLTDEQIAEIYDYQLAIDGDTTKAAINAVRVALGSMHFSLPVFQQLAEYWRGEPQGSQSSENAWNEMVAYLYSRAPEAPTSEQQTTVAMECVKAVSIGYTDTSHMTEELHCTECKANLDGGDDHKADCLTLRARAFLATPAATTASASMPVCNPIWYADEGNFGERVVRCRSCGTYKGTPCGITPAQQTERMQPSREADFDVDAILAAICEEAGYINLSMQSIREILAKHGAALARAPLPDPVYAEPASLRAEAPASEQRVKEVEQMSHLECYAELQDKWISEDDCNSVDFEAKYGRYTIEKIRSELQKHRAAATASPRCTCPSGDGSLRWPCPKHSTGEKQNG